MAGFIPPTFGVHNGESNVAPPLRGVPHCDALPLRRAGHHSAVGTRSEGLRWAARTDDFVPVGDGERLLISQQLVN